MLFSSVRKRHDAETQIFFHIPKTAGSTLNRILERQYSTRGVYFTYDYLRPEEAAQNFLQQPEAVRAATRVISGHLYFGIHEFLPTPSLQFTLLRDPIEREISNFYHTLRDTQCHYYQEYLRQFGTAPTLEAYIKSGFVTDIDNLQTRLLAGMNGQHEPVPYGHCDDAMLERAIHNLQTYFQFAGITEEFDTSVLLLQKMLGWSAPYYVKDNIGINRPPTTEISQQALDAIYKNTRYDRQLYEHVKREFHALIARQSPSFPDELQQFRTRNARYARRHALLSAALQLAGKAWRSTHLAANSRRASHILLLLSVCFPDACPYLDTSSP